MIKPALKVGLITDGGMASNYVADLAEWISQRSDVELTAEIVQHVWFLENGQLIKKFLFLIRRRGPVRTLRSVIFKAVSLLDQFLTQKISRLSVEFLSKKTKIESINRVEVRPKLSRTGFIYEYSQEDLKRVTELGCDVLIRCGSGILKGEILDCAEFGVLSFHHGDNSKFRGGPPGFWEVLLRESQTGFIIQRLTETLDGGQVLARGSVGTKPLFTWNRSYVMQQSSFAIYEILVKLARTRHLPNPLPQSELGQLYKLPSVTRMLCYLTSTLFLLFRKLIERILKSQPTWRVYIFDSNWQDIGTEKGIEIPNPDGCFTADPFLVPTESEKFLFAEEFSYEKKKAHIVVYDVTSPNVKRLGVALNEKFHISFPYVFKHDGHYFMCPETIERRQVRLYRATDFPLKWELQSILLDDVCAADPIIFFKNSKWWLLLNTDPICSGDSHSMLSIYHSDDLTGDSWQPSVSNPVLFDASCARNGGLLHSNDVLVRFGQVQGFNLYGESLRAFEIVNISEDDYQEVEVFVPKPNIGTKFIGTHHLSTTGHTTAVDIFR